MGGGVKAGSDRLCLHINCNRSSVISCQDSTQGDWLRQCHIALDSVSLNGLVSIANNHCGVGYVKTKSRALGFYSITFRSGHCRIKRKWLVSIAITVGLDLVKTSITFFFLKLSISIFVRIYPRVWESYLRSLVGIGL